MELPRHQLAFQLALVDRAGHRIIEVILDVRAVRAIDDQREPGTPAIDADDADITARYVQRDDPTYRDDAVEIFINPNPQQEAVYYGFEMNARGVLYDYLNYNSRTLFKRFDATGVTIATSLRGTLNVRTDTDTGWSLEAMIPWPNFEELSRRPPVAGAVWKANFNRWDGVEPNRRMSIWSDPQNDQSWPHVPSRFGEIVFVE